MRKFWLFALAVLLASPAAAQATRDGYAGLMYDVDATDLTYCTTTGAIQGQKLIASSGGGSSANLVPATGSSTPFTGMAVGDVLRIKIANLADGTPQYAWRVITTWTSASAVTVDSAITIALSPGASFDYYRNKCGTTINDGWVSVPAGASRFALSVFFLQGDIATLSARFECRTAGLNSIVIIYPGESSDCGLGAALSTDRCDWGVAKVGLADASLTVVDDAPVYEACRVGLAYKTSDTSEAAANLEKVTVTYTSR